MSKEEFLAELSDQTPEELNFNYDLKTLKKAACVFKIPGRSYMNKILLCLNIEQYLNDLGV
ncbi:hypothetical protein [Lysinibacillus piscis]|nr:hypothetical protein [Lysinibacillus sp. KH24]